MSDEKKNLQALTDDSLESVSGGVMPKPPVLKPVEPIVTEVDATTPVIKPVQPKETI